MSRLTKQKRRKDFVIVSFGIATSLLDEVDAAVKEQAERTRGVPLNRSSWIKRAIARDLAHRIRSRNRRKNAHQRNGPIAIPAASSAGSVHLPMDGGQPDAGAGLGTGGGQSPASPTDLGRGMVEAVQLPLYPVRWESDEAEDLGTADPAPSATPRPSGNQIIVIHETMPT